MVVPCATDSCWDNTLHQLQNANILPKTNNAFHNFDDLHINQILLPRIRKAKTIQPLSDCWNHKNHVCSN